MYVRGRVEYSTDTNDEVYELDMTELQSMLFQHVVLELDACLKTVLKSESEW